MCETTLMPRRPASYPPQALCRLGFTKATDAEDTDSLWGTRGAEPSHFLGFEVPCKITLSLLSKSHQSTLGEQQLEGGCPVVPTTSLPRPQTAQWLLLSTHGPSPSGLSQASSSLLAWSLPAAASTAWAPGQHPCPATLAGRPF